jgi:hypothetical protein
MAYDSAMNNLKLISKRLERVDNLTAFGKRYRIAYRTLQRMKSQEARPTLRTFDRISQALTKEGL